MLSLGTIAAILVGLLPLQSTENPASRVANAFWMALIRNNWGYSIAWIIFACQCGTGGVVKWFLELSIWQPLGRMSLSFYLVHTIYLTISVGSGKVPSHFNNRTLVSANGNRVRKTLNLVTQISIFSFTATLATSSFRSFLRQFFG
jgi:peptidoglycan/LPS O-acetylase OafA/YrhL